VARAASNESKREGASLTRSISLLHTLHAHNISATHIQHLTASHSISATHATRTASHSIPATHAHHLFATLDLLHDRVRSRSSAVGWLVEPLFPTTNLAGPPIARRDTNSSPLSQGHHCPTTDATPQLAR